MLVEKSNLKIAFRNLITDANTGIVIVHLCLLWEAVKMYVSIVGN